MMISIQQILEQATIVHRTGRLKEAAGLCRRILAIKPDHANSLHLLGAIAHDTGQTERAVDLIGQAIAIDNQSADFQSNTLEEGKRARRSALRTVSAVLRGGALLRICVFIYCSFYECRRIVTTDPFTECFESLSAWGVCHV
jgi:tetratricopeptide (TPR) repeat protein